MCGFSSSISSRAELTLPAWPNNSTSGHDDFKTDLKADRKRGSSSIITAVNKIVSNLKIKHNQQEKLI